MQAYRNSFPLFGQCFCFYLCVFLLGALSSTVEATVPVRLYQLLNNMQALCLCDGIQRGSIEVCCHSFCPIGLKLICMKLPKEKNLLERLLGPFERTHTHTHTHTVFVCFISPSVSRSLSPQASQQQQDRFHGTELLPRTPQFGDAVSFCVCARVSACEQELEQSGLSWGQGEGLGDERALIFTFVEDP